LSVDIRACANPYQGNGQHGGNLLGQSGRNFFQHNTKTPAFLEELEIDRKLYAVKVMRPELDKEPIAYTMGQQIWRYHPETRRFEVFSEGGGNAFGCEIDAKGRIFSGHNGGDTRGFHYMQGAYLQKGFDKHGPLSNPYAFGYFPPMPHPAVPSRRSSIRRSSRLTKHEGALSTIYFGRPTCGELSYGTGLTSFGTPGVAALLRYQSGIPPET
jgi:hypothetical protein